MAYCFNIKKMDILNKLIEDTLKGCSFIFYSNENKYYVLTLIYNENLLRIH